MRQRVRLIALAGVAALVMLMVPGVSSAIPLDVPHAPIITFPQNAGGYSTTSLTVTGTVDVTVDAVTSVTVRLGTPPCPPAGCGFGPIIGTDVPDLFGNWDVLITLPEGFHRIYVTAQNINGDSVAALRDFLLDITAPAAPVITFPTGGEVFTSANVPITGTGEPRAHIVITDEIGNVRSTTALLDGTWTYNALFPPGLHTITAFQRDLAQNLSPVSAAVSFSNVFDTTGPPPPVIDTPTEGQVVGPSGILISGTAEANALVEVCEDRPGPFQDVPPFMTPECEVVLGTDVADAVGAWAFTLPTQPPGQDGPHFIRARATDENGNLGLFSDIRHFTIDSRPPSVTISKPDLFLFASITLINGTELEGTATDNLGVARVRVRVFDLLGDLIADDVAQCPLCPATFVRWFDEPALNQPGIYFVEVTAEDLAGNVSPVEEITLIHVI